MSKFFNAANKGNNHWALYLLGIFIVSIAYVIGQIPALAVAHFRVKNNPNYGSDIMDRFNQTMDFSLIGINLNIGFILLLLIFVFAFFGLVLVMKFVHKRNFLTLVNIEERIDFKKVLFGFSLWFVLGALGELFTYFVEPSTYTFSFDFFNFVFLLIIGLFVLPIQTSFEELFLRGYIMQGFGLAFKYKWLAILLSAILFGIIHGANPEVSKYGVGVMMSYYIYAGIFFGLITVMDNSLELALGVHFATNLFGTLILGYESSAIQTDTLFKTHDMDAEIMLFFLVIYSVIFYLWSSKKYNWPSLKTVFEPIILNKEKEIEDFKIADNLF